VRLARTTSAEPQPSTHLLLPPTKHPARLAALETVLYRVATTKPERVVGNMPYLTIWEAVNSLVRPPSCASLMAHFPLRDVSCP
jgi:hypothetical protein